jgi:hypothetical protein
MTVIQMKPMTKVTSEMSPETAALVNKFVLRNATNTCCTHRPMTVEKLISMLLSDVAGAERDGGKTWEGCHMALVLREHGYWI